MNVDGERIKADVRQERRWLYAGDCAPIAPGTLCNHCEQLLAALAAAEAEVERLTLRLVLASQLDESAA